MSRLKAQEDIFTLDRLIDAAANIGTTVRMTATRPFGRGDTMQTEVRRDIQSEVDAAINKYERDEVAEAIELFRIPAERGNQTWDTSAMVTRSNSESQDDHNDPSFCHVMDTGIRGMRRQWWKRGGACAAP
jgi:hypothetical protein